VLLERAGLRKGVSEVSVWDASKEMQGKTMTLEWVGMNKLRNSTNRIWAKRSRAHSGVIPEVKKGATKASAV